MEREAAIEALPAEDFFSPREPLPAGAVAPAAAPPVAAEAPAVKPEPEPEPEAEPEPAMAAAGAGHTFDEEIDVPTYIRQRRALTS